MKFLCVACDEPMKLAEVSPPDRGSLAVRYRCPRCANEIAMLTNPYETQVVGSLGVEMGEGSAEGGSASKCPFSAVVQGAAGTPEGHDDHPDVVHWTADAAERLESIPEFARPMARTGIEKFARERGLAEIDAQVLEDARGFFGMS